MEIPPYPETRMERMPADVDEVLLEWFARLVDGQVAELEEVVLNPLFGQCVHPLAEILPDSLVVLPGRVDEETRSTSGRKPQSLGVQDVFNRG